MKTIKYFLSILPYPINKKALNNYKGTGFGYCGNIKIALTLAFDWDKSNEGYEYWHNVYNGNYSKYIRKESEINDEKKAYKLYVPKKGKAKRIELIKNKITKTSDIKKHMTHGLGKSKTYYSIDEAIDSILNTNHTKNL